MTKIKKSKVWELNKEDYIKVGKGALIASTGALVDFLAQFLLGLDFGSMTEIVYVGVPIVVNIIRKLIAKK